jgi:hypothetical protein
MVFIGPEVTLLSAAETFKPMVLSPALSEDFVCFTIALLEF